MRRLATEIATAGSAAVRDFSRLLDDGRSGVQEWAAFHILELMDAPSDLVDRAFEVLETRAKGEGVSTRDPDASEGASVSVRARSVTYLALDGRMTGPRLVDSLTPTDVARAPVWEFVNDDSQPDETYVRPVSELPVDSLDGRVVATDVTLRNGKRLLALVGNVDLASPRLTRHFLTLSLYIDDAWFHVARYHDFDAEQRGPVALARRLAMQLSEVFPIQYDLSQVAIGDPDVVRGAVFAEPSERLSRSVLIALATDGAE